MGSRDMHPSCVSIRDQSIGATSTLNRGRLGRGSESNPSLVGVRGLQKNESGRTSFFAAFLRVRGRTGRISGPVHFGTLLSEAGLSSSKHGMKEASSSTFSLPLKRSVIVRLRWALLRKLCEGVFGR